MELKYSEINPPKPVKPEPEPERYEPCSVCGCIDEIAYFGILIIGLPILGIVYALDFCFYKDGRVRPCFSFNSCFR
jgi:hypothetical protein